jgi:biopolymer transport protein ExbB/TolQ
MNIGPIHPLLAAGGLQFAFQRATTEGKATIAALAVLSLFSWSVIFNKTIQLNRAKKGARRFLASFRGATDPLALKRTGQPFEDAPLFQLYRRTADELEQILTSVPPPRDGPKRISASDFEMIKATLEEVAAEEAIGLERGMIVLSTAVAGGPFIGLLGTVWGVMETFAGIARANAATLTAMAPGVAGALIATVVGLLVAIPSMFAYNFMVTSIRHLTQELDSFAARFATQINQAYVEPSSKS